MPAVVRAQLGFLVRHPWQLALAVLGVLAGVAVMVAVDVANQSARKAFLASMDTITGEATHQVVGGSTGIDDALYSSLRVEYGIRNIAPVVEGDVELDGELLRVLGVDPFAERDMREFTSRLGGNGNGGQSDAIFRALLTQPGAAVLAASTARAFGLEENANFAVLAAGRRHTATLAGIVDDDAAAGIERLLIVDIATAQAWLDKNGRLTRIDVRLPAGDDSARAGFEALLPDNVALLSAAGRSEATADLSAAFMTNLTAMSLLALLVGLFLIYNSISFSVLQRRRLIGILRALGVTRIQTVSLVLAEAAVIGFVAAMLGVAAGTLLGEQLLGLVSQSINDLYFRVNVTDVDVSMASIVKGIAAGCGAAIAAAAVPAVEASGFQPRLALSRSTLERRSRQLLPVLALAGLVTLTAAAGVLALSGRSLVAGLVAVFMLILGAAMFVPPAVKMLTGPIAKLARFVGGTIGRVAVADIGASLSRTGVAIVALAVAVSATIGVQVMVDSFRASVTDWLDQSLRADIYVGVQRGNLDPALADELVRADGVAEVSTRQLVSLEDSRGRTQLLIIDMAPDAYAGTALIDAEPGDVWPAWETRDVVLVSEPYAYRNGVNKGDTIALPTDVGARQFEIAATYRSYDVNASAVLMSRQVHDRYWQDRSIDALGLYLDENADPDAVIARLEAISAERQILDINSNVRVRALSLEVFDRTFRITDVLYWLTLGVALVGILGAMLALQLERARELATLRALGMTPVQLGSMITTQTGVIGLLSGLAAIPLGLVMAWVLIEVINRRAFGWHIDLRVSGDILAAAVSFAIIAALVAGLYPAWRAAQSRPAIAMREE